MSTDSTQARAGAHSSDAARAGLIDRPFWWDAAPPQSRSGELPASVDVLIVGSGFTGLSAALTLARAGRSVLVCEAQEIGFGASTRNGGQISAKMRRGIASIAAEHGEARAIEVWSIAKASRAYLEALIARESIDCDFKPGARFYGAYRVRDYDSLAQLTGTLKRKMQLDVDPVPKSEQHRYVNSDLYHGGLVDRGTASFHPARYVAGLCERVESAGARVRSHTRVAGVTRQGDTFDVATSRGTVQARQVIVATNGYTGREFPALARRVIPIGSYLIATAPQPKAVIDALMPGCDMLIDTRRAASYMRVSPDRQRILYGGRVAATDISAQTSAPRLKAVLESIFPSLRSTGVTHAWMGFTGFTFDELPHLGRQDGLYFAMGYCGTGTAMGTYLGHSIAMEILGQPVAGVAALEELKFGTHSLYRGNPWFLSTLIGAYRLLDRLHV